MINQHQALAYAWATAEQRSPMMMRKCKLAILAIAILLQVHSGAGYLFGQASRAPQAPQAKAITRQETLRGSITPEREWWDVLHYHLRVEFLPETRRLKGSNTITFKAQKAGSKMQIDLQPTVSNYKDHPRRLAAQI